MRAAAPPSGRLALALIVALAALLRFGTLGVQSFSDDELFTAWLVRMSFGDMVETIPDSEATPHLFYVLEWLSVQVFGTGEVGTRLLPALFGTLTVAVVYAAGAAGASRRAGLAAAAVVAVNPFLIWFSQEARAYALLILLVAVSVLALVRFERSGSGRALAGWAAASVAAIATHYFAAFLVVPAAAWIAFGSGRRPRGRRAAAALPLVAGAALLPLALHQREAVGDPGGVAGDNLAERLAAVPKNFLVGFSFPAEGVVSALALLAGAALLVLAVTGTSGDERRLAVGMALLAACGVALPLVVAPFGFDYLSSRNVVAALVPLSLALGCGFAAHRTAPAVLGVLTALSVFAILGVALERKHQRRDWRGAAEALGPARTPRAVVFSPSFRNLGPFRIYYGSTSLYPRRQPPVGELALVGLAEHTSFGPGAPVPPKLATPPPPTGFRLTDDIRTDTYRLLRYVSDRPRVIPHPELTRFDLEDRSQVVLLQEPRP